MNLGKIIAVVNQKGGVGKVVDGVFQRDTLGQGCAGIGRAQLKIGHQGQKAQAGVNGAGQ